MPLLPAEPFLSPLNLFEEPPSKEEARWWVLHTRPRAEKSIGRSALRDRIPFFLPLHKRRWRNNGRLFTAHLPLFPGYVFIHGDERMRSRLLDTRQVANCLAVPDQQQLWTDLARVYRLIHSGVSLETRNRLTPGTRVLITSGSLAGFEGTLIRTSGKSKLVVDVRFIQCGVETEVEDWMVEPVGQTPSRRTG